MWLALTGTPGTGKTTVADELRRMGHLVLDLNRIVKEHGFILGRDRKRDTDIADLHGVSVFLEKEFGKVKDLVLEGHWAHKLQVDGAVVLRCHPKELRRRLKARGYKAPKVRENVEAEVVDVILVEAVEGLGERKVAEMDATKKGARAIARAVARVLENGEFKNHKVGCVDWSGVLMRD